MPAPASSPPSSASTRRRDRAKQAAPQGELAERGAAPRARCLGAGVLVLLVFAAFYPVLGHEFVEWDDHVVLYLNPDFLPPRLSTLGHYWTAAHMQFYVPLTYTIWWALAHVAAVPGSDGSYTLWPTPYHAMNLLAHLGSTVFAYRVLARLVRSERAGFAGAALFALHPLHAEPVSWASTMYSSLSGCLALGAMWAYFKFSDAHFGPAPAVGKEALSAASPSPAPQATPKRAWPWYVPFVAGYGLALITKPTIILLPVVIGLIEAALRRRRVATVAALLAPLLLAGALPIAIATQKAQPAMGVNSPPVLRPLIAADALAFYMRKIVLPFGLAPDYGRSPHWLMTEGSRAMFLTWVVPFAVFAAAAVAWRRTRWPAVACAVFVLGLAPMLGLTPFDYQRYSTVADRYAYFALIAPAMLAAAALARWPGRRGVTIALGVALVLGVLSHLQTRHWRDTDTLYAFAMVRNPGSFAAHTRAIRVLAAQGREDDALPHYQASVRAYPDSPRMWFGMGRIYLRKQSWAEAIDCFARANELEPDNASILSSLGVALAAGGRGDEAVAAVERAVALAPRDAATHLDAASVYGTVRRFDDARRHYLEVIRLNGNVAAAQRGLQVLDTIRSKG